MISLIELYARSQWLVILRNKARTTQYLLYMHILEVLSEEFCKLVVPDGKMLQCLISSNKLSVYLMQQFFCLILFILVHI